MLPTLKPPLRALTLLASVLLLSACASAPPPPPPVVVTPPRVPPLPQAARQPEPPAICRPTCSGGLATLLESWLPTPTQREPPAAPASGPTSR